MVLHGVDRSGTEFMCVQGLGIFDGPNDQSSINAMKKWHINAVRLPLNKACWTGAPYIRRVLSERAYQRAVEAYVRLLNVNGIIAILDLHWTTGEYTGPSSGCSSARAVCQKPMPDVGAIQFWSLQRKCFAATTRLSSISSMSLILKPPTDRTTIWHGDAGATEEPHARESHIQ